jgi:hypothetical protein
VPSLLELQRDFSTALLGGGPAPAGIEVYRSNVFGNCTQALGAAYPLVCKIVGEKFFDAMARAYARAQPSSSGDLNAYGAELARFVSAFPHTQDLPYLADVARMEWLAHRAYYAQDRTPFDRAALAQVPPDQYAALVPRLAPGSAVLASDWPLARIWEVHQDAYVGDPAVDLNSGPDYIVIFRPRWRVEVRALSVGEYCFFTGALRARTLGELIESACDIDPEFDPSTALARWIEYGAVAL